MNEEFNELEQIFAEALQDHIVHASAKENAFRRQLSVLILEHAKLLKVNLVDLAKDLNIPQVQMQRLMHKELGGRLDLSSVLRVTIALGVEIDWNINDGCGV